MKLGQAFTFVMLAAMSLTEAFGQCVYCATRNACFGAASGAVFCYIDRGTGSCMTSGSCGGNGYCSFCPPADDDGNDDAERGVVGLAPSRPQAFTRPEFPYTVADGYALEVNRQDMQAIAVAAPRHAEALWANIVLSWKSGRFGQSGEYVTSLKWRGADELYQAIAQGRGLPTIQEDPEHLRFSKSVLWLQDKQVMLIIRLKSSSVSDKLAEFDQELYATFERDGARVTSEGEKLPLFRLVRWSAAVIPVQGREFGRPPQSAAP